MAERAAKARTTSKTVATKPGCVPLKVMYDAAVGAAPMRDDRRRVVATGLLDRDGLISPAELAGYLQVPIGTLRQWRYLGVGPQALRLRGQVRYQPAEVRRWLAEDCNGGR